MQTKTVVIGAIAGGAFLFLASIASCVAFFVITFRNADRSFSPMVDELFAAIDAGNFADTYDTHTSTELRRITSREQYAELGRIIKAQLGALHSKKVRQFNLQTVNGRSMANIVYAATFDRGSGTIRVTFVKEGGQWRIMSFHVNSPVFKPLLATETCPDCGAPHAPDAQFCPQCGKPLGSKKSSEPQPAGDASHKDN